MALSDIIYLTKAQYETLLNGGSITSGGKTYTYDQNAQYCIPDARYKYTINGTDENETTFKCSVTTDLETTSVLALIKYVGGVLAVTDYDANAMLYLAYVDDALYTYKFDENASVSVTSTTLTKEEV